MAKIVHIVGNSGSGKTTLIKCFMKRLAFKPEFTEGRKSPIGYIGDKVFIPGSYEIATGGCDTIKPTELSFAIIHDIFYCGLDVVYEGLFMMNHTRVRELWEATRALEVICLTTSIEDCVKGVLYRRQATGKDYKDAPNFKRTFMEGDSRVDRYCEKLSQVGCPIHKVSREKALDKLLDILS